MFEKKSISIAFIRLGMFGNCSKDSMYPLSFAIVNAFTPKDVQLFFYDERVEKIPKNIEADIIAFTVETFSAKRTYKMAEFYKKQGKKIIMGGFHVTAMPYEALEHSDSVVIGELEGIWSKVIEDIKHNNLQKIYKNDENVPLSNIQYDYSIFKGKKYNPVGLVQFSRGCKYACEFCSIHSFFKNTVRTKSIETIINEIKNIKEKFIFFIDDNLFANEEEAIKLFKALIPLKKKWCCQISIDAAKNKDILKLMKKSGCILVLIGFESLNTENLKQMGKGANIKYNDYKEIINNIYNEGIMIYGTFVIGYDNDTKDTADMLCDFAIENKFAIANFNPLMPMPATKLYERMKKENRLTYEKWWLDDGYSYGDAMIIPKNMSETELSESCKNARYKFNTYGNIFKRFINFKANFRSLQNIVLFLLANIISKYEIQAKQGRKLG